MLLLKVFISCFSNEIHLRYGPLQSFMGLNDLSREVVSACLREFLPNERKYITSVKKSIKLLDEINKKNLLGDASISIKIAIRHFETPAEKAFVSNRLKDLFEMLEHESSKCHTKRHK